MFLNQDLNDNFNPVVSQVRKTFDVVNASVGAVVITHKDQIGARGIIKFVTTVQSLPFADPNNPQMVFCGLLNIQQPNEMRLGSRSLLVHFKFWATLVSPYE